MIKVLFKSGLFCSELLFRQELARIFTCYWNGVNSNERFGKF